MQNYGWSDLWLALTWQEGDVPRCSRAACPLEVPCLWSPVTQFLLLPFSSTLLSAINYQHWNSPGFVLFGVSRWMMRTVLQFCSLFAEEIHLKAADDSSYWKCSDEAIRPSNGASSIRSFLSVDWTAYYINLWWHCAHFAIKFRVSVWHNVRRGFLIRPFCVIWIPGQPFSVWFLAMVSRALELHKSTNRTKDFKATVQQNTKGSLVFLLKNMSMLTAKTGIGSTS